MLAGAGYMLQMRTAKAVRLASNAICQPVALSPGVNLLGLPAPPPGLTCFGVLSALGAQSVTSMQRFNTTSGRFETCGYADLGSGGVQAVGHDFPIVAEEGYLVHARASALLSLPGCGN